MESFLQTTKGASKIPTILTEKRRSVERVHSVNTEARELGIASGQTLSTARALHAGVQAHAHDQDIDESCLKDLATALFRFTPDVALDPPDGILLEVGRTTHLFGGETELVRKAVLLCREHGLSPSVGIAPTPMAARALARCGPPALRRTDEANAYRRISSLPWSVLRPAKDAATACSMLGLQTIGDLLTLPPHGLATRLGEELAQTLEALFEGDTESVSIHRAEERFDERIEWWPATIDLTQLCLAAEQLLRRLESFLNSRDEAAREVSFFLISASTRSAHQIDLRPSRSTALSETFLTLLNMRLERDGVPEPIDRMRLTINESLRLARVQQSLFQEAELPTAQDGSNLVDRLRNRLGDASVFQADLVADHRPECAYRRRHNGDERDELMAAPPLGRRPFHMDSPPLTLEVATNTSNEPVEIRMGLHRGPLQVISGPERLECGWWDGNDVRRLYFEVATATGVRLWIFQDKNTGAWQRHGVFA